MSTISDKQVAEALRLIRRELRAAAIAWDDYKLGAVGGGTKLTDIYAAFERLQFAAFEAKNLFAPEPPSPMAKAAALARSKEIHPSTGIYSEPDSAKAQATRQQPGAPGWPRGQRS